MALTVTQIANILFKKLQGVGSTNDSRQFFEEPYLGRSAVHNSQIWVQSGSIPSTAPGGVDGAVTGVVTRYIDKALTAVAGTSNSFYHADLVDAIPFNFGDGTYNYEVKDSLGASIPFGSGDWVVDGDAGILTFYGTVPSNMPPTISFYKYSGTKGASAGSGATTYTPTQRTITTSGAVATTDGTIFVDATSGDVDVTLSPATDAQRYKIFRVDATANIVRILPDGTDNIMGETEQCLAAQYDGGEFEGDGTDTYYFD